jgi:8-oxo-dGTP pyrophosphatase MutT (NUDIX family)
MDNKLIVELTDVTFTYCISELQDMLSDKEAYEEADNLPKWLAIENDFDWDLVYSYIETLEHRLGFEDVSININDEIPFTKLIKYTLGFIFNPELDKTLLIEMNQKHKWNYGLINACGGKQDKGETPAECIARECLEETGFSSQAEDWDYTGVYRGLHEGNRFEVKVYTTIRGQYNYNWIAYGPEGTVQWYDIEAIPNNTVSNFKWMLPFALDKAKGGTKGCFEVQ